MLPSSNDICCDTLSSEAATTLSSTLMLSANLEISISNLAVCLQKSALNGFPSTFNRS